MGGEIVVERRRRWAPEEKAALMVEVEAEGGHASSLPSGTGSRRARCTIGDRPGRPPVWQREQSRPVAEIRSAWCRCRRRPGPDDTNDNWRGMPAGTGLALAERGWGSSARR